MKKKAYNIIHEDDVLLALDKSAGTLCVPDRYDITKPNLLHYLTDRYQEIFPVHRLDRGTSGVMLYAKNAETHKQLSVLFEERTIHKVYHTIVKGCPNQKEGEIDAPIGNDKTQKQKAIHARGQHALTHYKVLKEWNGYSLLECIISTGRQHQIRLHMRHIGCPLAYDKKYGEDEPIYASDIKRRRFNKKDEDRTPRALMDRLSLHAYELTFSHPSDGKTVTYQAPYHKDFRALCNQLDKWAIK